MAPLGQSALFKWEELIMQVAEMGGVDTRANDKFRQQLKEQGFVNIVYGSMNGRLANGRKLRRRNKLEKRLR